MSTVGRCAVICYLLHSVLSQDLAVLTFSSNPVYADMPLTLTCNYGPGVLLSVAVDAFNGTRKVGSLSCGVQAGTTTDVGVFRNSNFTGCPVIAVGATNASVTLTVTSSLELDYNCSATKVDGITVRTPASQVVPLQVFVCPSTPNFQPDPIAFSDSDKGTIMCESRNGKPAALVSLTASDIRGARLASGNFSDSAPLVLTPPLSNWHNATVTCSVLNHNCSNMSVTRGVFIGFNTSVPDVVCTNESNVVLNCSKHIWSYPGFVYKWAIPAEANVTGSLDFESFTVPQGQAGTFNCTATNNYSMASVVISFTVNNVCHPITTSTETPVNSPSDFVKWGWIILLVILIIVVIVIAIIICLQCKRGRLSKRRNKPTPSGTDQRSDNGSNRGLVVGRLLIAAEGVVSQLSLRTLRTTAVIEYSHQSCSLNDILKKVEQAVPRSSPKFKSVALLPHPAKVGVTLSEVDQAVLNATSIQGEKGEKLRTFIARLAEICLDERGGTRMDILNYNGKAPLKLSEALTNHLGIPTTVSRDQFGVGTRTGEEGGHADVADVYFDRSNLGEVVYAELQQTVGNPQAQPRQLDERVIYSEIKR